MSENQETKCGNCGKSMPDDSTDGIILCKDIGDGPLMTEQEWDLQEPSYTCECHFFCRGCARSILAGNGKERGEAMA